MPNIQYFTPDTAVPSTGTYANAVNNAVALPNAADALLYIVNAGPNSIAFMLGTTSAVTTTVSTGMVLIAGQSIIVGAQGMTYIALIAVGALSFSGMSNGSTVNLTSGN